MDIKCEKEIKCLKFNTGQSTVKQKYWQDKFGIVYNAKCEDCSSNINPFTFYIRESDLLLICYVCAGNKCNMSPRRQIWEYYYYDKYEVKCRCGIHNMNPFTFDQGHNIAKSKNGSNDIKNITPVCRTCNIGQETKTNNQYENELNISKNPNITSINIKIVNSDFYNKNHFLYPEEGISTYSLSNAELLQNRFGDPQTIILELKNIDYGGYSDDRLYVSSSWKYDLNDFETESFYTEDDIKLFENNGINPYIIINHIYTGFTHNSGTGSYYLMKYMNKYIPLLHIDDIKERLDRISKKTQYWISEN